MVKKNKLQKVIVATCCIVISLNVIAQEFKKDTFFVSTVQQSYDMAGNGLAKPKGTQLRIASYNVFRTKIFNGNREESWKRLHNALDPGIWFLNEMFYSDDPAPTSDGDAFLQHVRDFTGELDWNYSWDAKGRYLLTKYKVVWSKSVGRRTHVTWIDLPSSVSSKDLLAINVHFMRDNHSEETRDFIRQVRTGTYSGADIPQDISILVVGDFNAKRGHARYNYIADEGFADPIPLHIGTNEDKSFGDSNLSGGELVEVLGNDIDFILHQSDVLKCSNSFIPNTLVLDQDVLDKYGLHRGDVALNPDDNHDFINGRIACDHYPQVADFFDSTIPLPNDAEFVSQDVPSNIDPGETVTVRISMKNSGGNTWTAADNFVLGSWGVSSDNHWGISSVSLNEGEQIASYETKIFEFEVTAPTDAGIYHFQWRMQEENVEWFGDLSRKELIRVGDAERFLDACDFLTGWSSQGTLSLNNTDNKQGDACIVFTGDGTQEFRKAFTTPYSIGGVEADLAMGFWYYISDPSKMDGSNQVELGSGGQADVDEYNWGLENLTAGWNYIQLKLSDAVKVGNPDLSSINWFRFYSFKSGSVRTMIDGIKISAISTDVSIKELNSKNILNVYPNPVYDNRIHVEFSVESFANVSISVLNMDGSLVLQPYGNRLFQTGDHKVDIPLLNIRRGIYFLEVVIDGRRQSHKFLVM